MNSDANHGRLTEQDVRMMQFACPHSVDIDLLYHLRSDVISAEASKRIVGISFFDVGNGRKLEVESRKERVAPNSKMAEGTKKMDHEVLTTAVSPSEGRCTRKTAHGRRGAIRTRMSSSRGNSSRPRT